MSELAAGNGAPPSLRRRILFLTPQLPYPPEQGTAIRNYNLIAQVATRHDVALLSFSDLGRDEVGPLADWCHPLQRIPAPSRPKLARLRTMLTTPLPDMAERLASAKFAGALREVLARERFDVVQVEGIEMARYGHLVREVLGSAAPAVILDEHNAEYVLQRRAFETDTHLPRRWLAALYSLVQWRRLVGYERSVCRDADAVLAVSEADAVALATLTPGLMPLVVPNGVDTASYHPALPDTLPLRHPAIVFTGKMDFRPNVDGVLWFYHTAWPLVRAQNPDAHLYVVGKNPHRSLAPLRGDASVTLTGYVADIMPYFGGADVYIVPLRVGGGTRLKVLEALAAGLPLVTTTLGAEGIDLLPERHALVADVPADFAAAITSLLRDRERREALAQAGRALVLECYDWRSLAQRLEPLYALL
jgi:glycosyltransferase involved in cell wall biosynthesis